MKIALLGDTHFGARGDNIHFHRYFKKFYDNVFFPYLEEHNINRVIQFGDIFDRRKYINFHSLQLCKEYFFDKLKEKKIPAWILTGNHDTYFKNTNNVNSPNLLLQEYDNLALINEPVDITIDGLDLLLVPWMCLDNHQMCMDAMKNTKSQIVIGHFEIKGFEMHIGAFCDKGLNEDIFNKFDTVLSGHFHHKSNRKNITYVGTPYEMTWSDFEDPKGFHILDTETREIEYVRNPYTMFHKVWYDDSNASMDEILAQDVEKYNGCIVKVIIKNKLNPVWFDMFIEKIEKSGVVDMQIVEDHLNLNLEDDEDIISEAEDTPTILSKYIDSLDIKADKKQLENLLRSLYNEALTLG